MLDRTIDLIKTRGEIDLSSVHVEFPTRKQGTAGTWPILNASYVTQAVIINAISGFTSRHKITKTRRFFVENGDTYRRYVTCICTDPEITPVADEFRASSRT